MNHEEIQDRLTEFRDGRLTQESKSEILRHLSGCPSCVQELNELERIARAFFPRPLPPDPEDTEAFVVAVMARLPAPAFVELSYPAPRWWAPAMGLAFAAFVAALWLPFEEAGDPLAPLQIAQEYTPDNLLSFVSEDR